MTNQYELSCADTLRSWPDNPTHDIEQRNVSSIVDIWNEEVIFQPDVERNLTP